jgi:hypothetical protein
MIGCHWIYHSHAVVPPPLLANTTREREEGFVVSRLLREERRGTL